MKYFGRSPYIVLSVPMGCTRDEAAAAFARGVRRLRREPECGLTQEDLTWALREIENPNADLASSIEYLRHPAGSAGFPEPAPGELFVEPPVPMPRSTPPMSEHDRDALRLRILAAEAASILESLIPVLHSPYHEHKEQA